MNSSNQGISLTIVTYDDIHQVIARQRDGLGDEYRTRSAVVHLSAADLKKLGLKNGAPIELKGKSGSVVVTAKSETAIEEGIGHMPSSLYSNYLGSYDPSVSQLPNLKMIGVTAMPTEKNITPPSDLLVRREIA